MLLSTRTAIVSTLAALYARVSGDDFTGLGYTVRVDGATLQHIDPGNIAIGGITIHINLFYPVIIQASQWRIIVQVV